MGLFLDVVGLVGKSAARHLNTAIEASAVAKAMFEKTQELRRRITTAAYKLPKMQKEEELDAVLAKFVQGILSTGLEALKGVDLESRDSRVMSFTSYTIKAVENRVSRVERFIELHARLISRADAYEVLDALADEILAPPPTDPSTRPVGLTFEEE